MKQEKIKYRDVMNLKFHEEFHTDSLWFDQYGYEYSIVQKQLTKKIYLQWDKDTQLCNMYRIDNLKEQNIVSELPVMNLDHLKEIIDFFIGN